MAKRKPKSNTFRRKHDSKLPKDRVLIVAEGNTELIYFKGLRKHLKINSLKVICKDTTKNDPKGILEEAKELYRHSEKEKNKYDRVYCAFDKDQHRTFKNTLDNIQKLSPKNTYFGIFSIPCFEYWLLLHFKNTSKPFNKCDEVCSELKKKIRNYAKGDENFFDRCKDNIPQACKHVQNDLQIAELTNVNELIKYLDNLSENTSILS